MPTDTLATTFLGVEPSEIHRAWAVVAPAPYDRGASESAGARLGPAAVLAASAFVETYDLEAGRDPTEGGIATAAPIRFSYADGQASVAPVAALVEAELRAGRFPLLLGGEATILCGSAVALESAGGIGVVRIEGTLGCDDAWRGLRLAPRTATRRAAERVPVRVCGHRTAGAAAREWVRGRAIEGDIADPAAGLPGAVWLAIDLSALDPSVMPMPGNLEPGGLSYRDLAGAVAAVFSARRVAGAELTGLVTGSGDIVPAFTAARIALRILALAHRRRFP